ncbi:unnamed protein product [Blumeria hordei]|uniref:Uncharacterized protein n=1 Tax=Blumeria hordei TaxID=2867405 RepID=A0A383UV62_BLUHO|nr:unnamed protein product [Blumeria hordei]
MWMGNLSARYRHRDCVGQGKKKKHEMTPALLAVPRPRNALPAPQKQTDHLDHDRLALALQSEESLNSMYRDLLQVVDLCHTSKVQGNQVRLASALSQNNSREAVDVRWL